MSSATMGHSEQASRLYMKPRITIGTKGVTSVNATMAWQAYVPVSAISTCAGVRNARTQTCACPEQVAAQPVDHEAKHGRGAGADDVHQAANSERQSTAL